VATRADANTIMGEVRKQDGSVIGGGTYTVPFDGKLLAPSTFGRDTQLREFKQHSVRERQ